MRGATVLPVYTMNESTFQSTRPVRGATQGGLDYVGFEIDISIHAPRAGRDPFVSLTTRAVNHFNPRAPCGARQLKPEISGTAQKFQSTRPVRGATRAVFISLRIPALISIHAPRAGRDNRHGPVVHRISISIHAPRAGRDCC